MKDRGSQAELTPRELEVLELVASGNSAKEVAGLIGIAPTTVERHIESVRIKIRARNRTHMVAKAILSGVLKALPGITGPGFRLERFSQQLGEMPRAEEQDTSGTKQFEYLAVRASIQPGPTSPIAHLASSCGKRE